jgi:dTDP-4-dehydrorhamnose reductase
MSTEPAQRVLVTGAAGMLGSQLLLDAPDGAEVVGTDLATDGAAGAPALTAPGVDLADPAAVARLFAEHGPFTAVFHTAAYTAVDRAESEPELAHRVNAEVPGVLARACAEADAWLVLVSTDFVFDGTADRPYRPSDATGPCGVYGRTKLAGEQAALAAWAAGTRVVRTQWLYGPRGKHFPGTMLRLAGERDALRVVDDQRGSPTSTLELSPALWDLLRLGAPPGIYHAACEGDATWFEFAREVLAAAGRSVDLAPCTTAEYPVPAPRPAYSVLDSSELTELRGRPLKPWRAALDDFLMQEGVKS